jgi:hypothetical protein
MTAESGGATATAAFLTELRDTYQACDLDPRITADDHVVRELWINLTDQQRSHLLLRLAWLTRVPLTVMGEPYDDATQDAHALHQAATSSRSAAGFCGVEPRDVPGLRHQAADLARALGDPEFWDESLLTAALLHAFAAHCANPDKPPPPRGRRRPPADTRTARPPWLRSVA